MLVKKNILGTGITDESSENILEYVIDMLEKRSEKLKIFTPNPEMLVYAQHYSRFKKTLNEANIALCDGVGVFLASYFLGKPLQSRFSGVDFMIEVCKRVSRKPIMVGFLGAGPGVAKKTAECLAQQYPGLKVGFAGSEWDSNKVIDARRKTSKRSTRGPASAFLPDSARSSLAAGGGANELHAVGSPSSRVTPHIDILFVAFGFPKQEEWIAKNIDKLAVQAAVGVGGSFDYISGQVARAPRWVCTMGFEWLYRLICQPWRIKRQLALLEFIWLVFKEKYKI